MSEGLHTLLHLNKNLVSNDVDMVRQVGDVVLRMTDLYQGVLSFLLILFINISHMNRSSGWASMIYCIFYCFSVKSMNV